MCRIIAYIGEALTASSLFHEAPHGLTDQSLNAKLMTDSSVAGDGWAVGWFCPQAGPSPGLIKSVLPLWSDENGRTATRAIRSGSIVGHIRLAAPGVETCYLNTPLYALEDHLWTINGAIEPWPGPIAKAIRDRLDPDHEADLRGSTDGEMLGALWRTCFRREGGRDAAAAVRSMLREAVEIVRRLRGTMKVNLILAGPHEGLAVRFADSGDQNSLFSCAGEVRWGGGVLIASEPLDAGHGWQEVDANTLVRFDGRGARTEPLDVRVERG